jgi:galactokinase
VGTFGGSEDHTAILCAEPSRVVQYAFCPVRRQRTIAIPEGYVFVIGVSGVVADKTGGALEKYNRVAKLAAAATELWREATGRDDPHLAAAIASSADAREQLLEIVRSSSHADYAADKLLARVAQFVMEDREIIPSAADALDAGFVWEFGELVDRSQKLGARRLENQTPETEWLAGAAREFGASAASAFGAGFGGSVWALVRTSMAAALLERWSTAYAQRFPQAATRSEFFITQAGPAAFQLKEP